MAYQQIPGRGILAPSIPNMTFPLAYSAGLLIDATGEKVGMIGRVWFPARTGTKTLERVCFRFGAVTKSGLSALTLGLYDVDLTTGPPGVPTGTPQTVAIANADAAFITSGWLRSGTLSRSVTYRDRLAIVIEYDGAGRLVSDSVVVAAISYGGVTQHFQTCFNILNTAGSWALVGSSVNVILEFSDGTFGTLDGAFPAAVLNTHAHNSGTGTADEYAATIRFPFPCKVDGLWAVAAVTAGADFELILYDGTTAMATVAVDANTIGAATGKPILEPITEQTLLANTTYRVALRPTTANNISAYSMDVADANHFTCQDAGIVCTFDTRLDQGAWIGAVATRRLLAGVRISSLDDAVGGVKRPIKGDMIYFRKSTASQEFTVGPMMSSTDGDTEMTALTIANTDIKVLKAGATTLVSKNSGGGTHISNGIYSCVADATDTNTVGSGMIFVHVAGALVYQVGFTVLDGQPYDAIIANTNYIAADVGRVGGQTASAAGTVTFPGTIASSTNITAGTITTVGTLTTYTGNTPQTGDNFARIGAAGVGLTAVSLSTAGILAIWHQLVSAVVTAGTMGKLLIDTLTGHTPQTGDSFGRIGATGSGLSTLATAANLTTAQSSLTTLVAGMGALTAGERNSIADAIFARSLGTEGYAADGAVPTLAQFCFMVLSGLFEFSISGTTITAKKLDGSAQAMVFTLDSATTPTSRTRAT